MKGVAVVVGEGGAKEIGNGVSGWIGGVFWDGGEGGCAAGHWCIGYCEHRDRHGVCIAQRSGIGIGAENGECVRAVVVRCWCVGECGESSIDLRLAAAEGEISGVVVAAADLGTRADVNRERAVVDGELCGGEVAIGIADADAVDGEGGVFLGG